MEKFLCKNCGACCTKFNSIGALPFFEWEIETIIKEAEKRGINLNIQPTNSMFDEISGICFFPQYGMFNEPCPFLKEKKCLIYEKRSYICRMFPLTKSPLLIDDKVEPNWFSGCPNFDTKKFIEEANSKELTKEELNKQFKDSFGECNDVCFRATRTRYKLNNIVINLINQGKVKLRRVREGEKIEKVLPIMEFLTKINAITLKEKREIIKEFEN